jgi:hypothetical protein
MNVDRRHLFRASLAAAAARAYLSVVPSFRLIQN